MRQSLQICFANCRPAGIWLSILFFSVTIPLSAQTITTVAGSDLKGDGGQATGANLYSPYGVVDGSDNLYIVDTGNQRIRKVSTTGIRLPRTSLRGSRPAGRAADAGS